MKRNSRARVLVVDGVELEGKRLLRTLSEAGYSNVVHRADLRGARAELEASHPRIVITELKVGSASGLELIREIRARDAESYVYVIVLTAHPSDPNLRAAFNDGADGFLSKPLDDGEMVARIQAGERIVELETSLRMKSRELETALRRIDVAAAQRALAHAAELVKRPAEGATPLDALLGTETWQDIGMTLASAIGAFVQLPTAPVPTTSEPEGAFVAEILLAEPAQQLELGLAVLVDPAAMKELALHLLGTDDDLESTHALVLEVGNILMGTLKTTFSAHGFNFTGGIPAEVKLEQAREALTGSNVHVKTRVRAGEAAIELWLRVREKRNTTIRGRLLREGLVLGEDIRDVNGLLLIKSGTRLTSTTAQRLAKLVSEREITVTDSAA
jgi:DNA-binding NarL/FixJ family response regulator